MIHWNDDQEVLMHIEDSLRNGDFEMGTRGIIARKTDGGFSGVYHHWDSYPDALGKTLFQLYQGHFNKDAKQMMHMLIDEHQAGWSTIVDADFSLVPGFPTDEAYVKDDNAPRCYCHGARYEPAKLFTGTPRWCEYLYVINEETAEMDVFAGATHLVTIDLDGVEPDWDEIGD